MQAMSIDEGSLWTARFPAQQRNGQEKWQSNVSLAARFLYS
jgi:hypothetical protein